MPSLLCLLPLLLLLPQRSAAAAGVGVHDVSPACSMMDIACVSVHLQVRTHASDAATLLAAAGEQ